MFIYIFYFYGNKPTGPFRIRHAPQLHPSRSEEPDEPRIAHLLSTWTTLQPLKRGLRLRQKQPPQGGGSETKYHNVKQLPVVPRPPKAAGGPLIRIPERCAPKTRRRAARRPLPRLKPAAPEVPKQPVLSRVQNRTKISSPTRRRRSQTMPRRRQPPHMVVRRGRLSVCA